MPSARMLMRANEQRIQQCSDKKAFCGSVTRDRIRIFAAPAAFYNQEIIEYLQLTADFYFFYSSEKCCAGGQTINPRFALAVHSAQEK